MSKAYLLAYSDDVGSREVVKGYLNSMSEVTHWRYDMPHTFYVISEASAQALSDRFRELGGSKGRFVFVEFTDNHQGWLTKASWHLINHKRLQAQG